MSEFSEKKNMVNNMYTHYCTVLREKKLARDMLKASLVSAKAPTTPSRTLVCVHHARRVTSHETVLIDLCVYVAYCGNYFKLNFVRHNAYIYLQ